MTHRPIRIPNTTVFKGPSITKAKLNGFDLNHLLSTNDGDEVIVLAVQEGHPYPIVGEVHDYNSNVGWLARWNLAGQYRGTVDATAKHSLERNVMSSTDVYSKTFAAATRERIEEKAKPESAMSMSMRAPTNLGQLLRDKLDRDQRAVDAVEQRRELIRGLGSIYTAALEEHSHLTVAAIARHVDRLIEEKRLRFPDGLRGVTFEDLGVAVRALSSNPGMIAVVHIQ